MNTINCPACGKELAASAFWCPHCGQRKPLNVSTNITIFWIIFAATVFNLPWAVIHWLFGWNRDEFIFVAFDCVFSLWAWVISAAFWGVLFLIWRRTKKASAVALGAVGAFLVLCVIGRIMMSPMTMDQFRQAVMGKTKSEVDKMSAGDFRVKDTGEEHEYSGGVEGPTYHLYYASPLRDTSTGKVGEVCYSIHFDDKSKKATKIEQVGGIDTKPP
jgi:hypothetical protein